MSSSTALAALVGPIKYASAKGFANLERVKGLQALVEGAVAKARAEGVDPAALQALEAVTRDLDSADLAARRHAVTQVGEALAALGLPAGFEAALPRAP
ncbi:MAG: hypothetical protein JNK82_22150, partial [Myxococcaceae bacterium]|nr:hypothetical protein [Myxococcaceae bacterium]